MAWFPSTRCVMMALLLAPAVATHAWAQAPDRCVEVRANYSVDSVPKGVHPAEPTSVLTLPRAPQDDVGKDVELKLLVNILGGVDSVRVRGTVSSTYEERLRVTMKRYRFRPATWQKCPVPFWMTFQVTP